MINLYRQHRHELLIYLILLGSTLILEAFFLPESIAANAVWFIPIAAAAIMFPPRIAAVLVFIIFSVFSAHAVIRSDSSGMMVAVALPAFAVTSLLASTAARRSFRQINMVRDALDQSPLAYAEFSFPGYKLSLANSTFRQLVPGSEKGLVPLDFLPGDSARNLAAIMDESVSKRARVDCNEFRLVDNNGKEHYLRIDVIPVIQSSRGTAQAVSLFAFDVTENFNRNRTRESALRISSAVMSSLEMEAALDIVLQNLTYSTGADTGLLFLLEDEQWIGRAAIGNISTEQAAQMRFPYDDLWPAVEAVLSRRARNTPDGLHEFSSAEAVREMKMGSNMVVPLVSANRVIGAAWCIRSYDAREFSGDQLEFATIVGSQAALAVENASIYENERAMRRSLEAIEAVSEAGLTSLDLDEVLTELVTRTYDVMRMDSAMILLADSKWQNLVVRAAAGSVKLKEGCDRIPIGEGLAGKAFESSTPMKVDDVGDRGEELCSCMRDSETKSLLAVPLRINNRTTGILQIGSTRRNAFSAREWGLIQVLADRASHAVQNSMLHEQTRAELARAKLLRDVASACAHAGDLKQIAQHALAAVYEQLGCATAGIFYHDKKRDVLVNLAFLGHSDELARELEVIDIQRDTLLNKAVNECATVTHDNWPDLSESQAQVLADLGALDSRRAAMPIIYKEEVIGGFALTMPGQEPWSQVEMDTFESIANQIAVAIASSNTPVAGYAPMKTVD